MSLRLVLDRPILIFRICTHFYAHRHFGNNETNRVDLTSHKLYRSHLDAEFYIVSPDRDAHELEISLNRIIIMSNSLKGCIQTLCNKRDELKEAKQLWLSNQLSEDALSYRTLFNALDDQFENLFGTLIELLQSLASDGLIALEARLLTSAERAQLENILSERGMSQLLNETLPDNLMKIFQLWREADASLIAAKEVNEIRAGLSSDQFSEAIESYRGPVRIRNEQAWNRAINTFSLHKALYQNQDGGSIDGLATFDTVAFFQSRYDKLSDKLIDVVRWLKTTGAFRFELEVLEPAERRSLVEFSESHILDSSLETSHR
jgi:hypothetical protein